MKVKKKSKVKGLFLILLIILIGSKSIFAENFLAKKDTIKIAVLNDGFKPPEEILNLITPQLNHMASDYFTVKFVYDEKYSSGYDYGNIKKSLNRALNDNKIDMILGFGEMITQTANEQSQNLSKPFISGTLIKDYFEEINLNSENKISKENLSLIISTDYLSKDLKFFSSIENYKTIYIGIPRYLVDNIEGIDKSISLLSKRINVELKLLKIDNDPGKLKTNLPEDMKAVYLPYHPKLSRKSLNELLGIFNSKKIRTFVDRGIIDPEVDALAGKSSGLSKEISRRIALNIFNVINGTKTSELNVLFYHTPKYVVNSKIAKQIGFKPNLNLKVEANFINENFDRQRNEVLNLPLLLRKVTAKNLSLAISQEQVKSTLKDKQIVRSNLLPQIGLGGKYEKTRGRNMNGMTPDEQTLAGFNVKQMIFNDEVISGYRSSDRLYEASKEENKMVKLDLFKQAEEIFYGYAQARIILDIHKENLRITEENLALAETRVSVGYSGKNEVYRWNMELAMKKANLLSAESNLQSIRIALNQMLNEDLNKDWSIEENVAKDENFNTINSFFAEVINSPENYDKFKYAAINYAKENSPELKVLKNNIEAKEIMASQKKRSFITPIIYTDFDYAHIFDQSKAQVTIPEDGWTFSVTASIPLFQGGKKISEIQKDQIVLDELSNRMILTGQVIELKVRTALRKLESSIPNIRFTQEASKNASKNFKIARDMYADGVINITQFLDAQNASFQAKQNSTIAKYKFLTDMSEFQRSMGFFAADKNEAQLSAIEEILKEKIFNTKKR